MRITELTCLVGVLGVATAACSHDVVGQANAASSPDGPTPQLAIPAALDIAHLDPCTVLSDAVLAPITGNLDSRTPGKAAVSGPGTGSSCLMFPTDLNRPRVSVILYPGIGAQPDRLYASGPSFPFYAKATPIAGAYPAVHTAQGANGPQTGECGTTFSADATSEVEVYVVTVNDADPTYTHMCTVSDQLAADLITSSPKV